MLYILYNTEVNNSCPLCFFSIAKHAVTRANPLLCCSTSSPLDVGNKTLLAIPTRKCTLLT